MILTTTKAMDPAEFRFPTIEMSRPMMFVRLSMGLAHLLNPTRQLHQSERVKAMVLELMEYQP